MCHSSGYSLQQASNIDPSASIASGNRTAQAAITAQSFQCSEYWSATARSTSATLNSSLPSTFPRSSRQRHPQPQHTNTLRGTARRIRQCSTSAKCNAVDQLHFLHRWYDASSYLTMRTLRLQLLSPAHLHVQHRPMIHAQPLLAPTLPMSSSEQIATTTRHCSVSTRLSLLNLRTGGWSPPTKMLHSTGRMAPRQVNHIEAMLLRHNAARSSSCIVCTNSVTLWAC